MARSLHIEQERILGNQVLPVTQQVTGDAGSLIMTTDKYGGFPK